MTEQEGKILLGKYDQGLCSAEEKALVESWYLNLSDGAPQMDGEPDYDYWYARIQDNLPVKSSGSFRLWPKIAVAAVMLMAVGAGLIFYTNGRKSYTNAGPAYTNDIAPGKNGATITLANGRVIQLSDAKTGVVVGSALKYSDGSDVRYSSGSRSSGSLKGSQNSTGPVGVHSLTPAELQGADSKGQMLTASTAKGQTYQFTLPDGTKVWLNADSKLEFPSSFVNSETRFVKLSGEGYFEVAKDKAHPFIVKTKNQDVTVLGTHFNIKGYEDEHVTATTLVEGSVRVSSFDVALGRRTEVLKPNQQSIQNQSGGMQVRNVDVDEVVAWKAGDFIFTKETLAGIMKSIARWYDVEISYDPGVDTDQTFSVLVSRNKNISQILLSLEKTGKVKFKIEGKKVKVGR